MLPSAATGADPVRDVAQPPEPAQDHGPAAAYEQLSLGEDGLARTDEPRPQSLASSPRALTGEQLQAVERRGEPLALAAGAGSGKTSVLVERFVRAVRDDGHPPERILAITFTERAAAELKERVRLGLLAGGAGEQAGAIERGYLGTFHGFCARILRADGGMVGLAADFEILEEGLTGRLRRHAFASALADFLAGERPQVVELIAASGADRARATVLGVFAELRSRGQREPSLPRPELGDEPEAHELAGARAVALWDELLQRFAGHYEDAKRERGGLDFDDLELRAAELLAHDTRVRSAWADRFELLMVDELQDVNLRQLSLLRALERENLFTVGDQWQAIYGFRHADVSLFRAREEQLRERGASLRLAENFRGRPELLAAVNAVFAKRFGESFTPLRAGRESERDHEAEREPLLELLLSDRRGWEHGGEGSADGGGERLALAWREAEARALADRVAELVADGRASAGDVAVLLRGTSDIDCYEQALRARGLRTVADAGAFWRRQEVCDLLACMRAIADPLDEVGLYGTLASPLVGLSMEALALLARAGASSGRGLWETVGEPPVEGLETRHGEKLAQAREWLSRQRALAGEATLAQMLGRIVEERGYAAVLASLVDGERRLANVGKLADLAERWERSEGRDLPGFLAEAAFQQALGGGFLAGAEATAEADAPAGSEARDAVRLMSVHGAKGLEFEIVCVADLGRAPSTGVPDLLVDGERVGVRLLDLQESRSSPALAYTQLAQERREAQAAEEDRILYVAMTRARERLILSGAADFAAWPPDRSGAAPIAWLGPALSSELPTLCREARGRVERTLALDEADVAISCRLQTPRGRRNGATTG